MDDRTQLRRATARKAEARRIEIEELFEQMKARVRQMIKDMATPAGEPPKKVLAKLDELQTAHLKALAAEQAALAHLEEGQDFEEINYDALRSDIGREIDRIRASL